MVVDGVVSDASVAFGGMAATPRRARATEAALVGLVLDDPSTWTPALAALGDDFQPISDMRASAGYRLDVARSLLTKALAEVGGTRTAETRLVGRRENVDAA
jgi:xanthine dehydrogenase small subunit